FLLRQRRRPAFVIHMHDDDRAADAELAVTRDLERPRDRGLAEPLGADVHLDLVLEHEHLQELRFDLPARVVAPALDEAELAPDPGLGHLGPAERGREVDPPAGVGVDPLNAGPLDVLDGHGRTRTRPGVPLMDASIAALMSSSG